MQVITINDPDRGFKLSKLYRRAGYPAEAEQAAREMIEQVRLQGDVALSDFARKFDHVSLQPDEFRVTDFELAQAEKALSAADKRDIRAAYRHIVDFAKQTMPKGRTFSPRPGVTLGEKFSPMERVGVYIPGGTAPLVSTVLHTAGIAAVAGVREIVAVTPARKDKSVHPAVLYAMKLAGVTEIYRLGGVYGVAALGLGTESIRKVEKIVGPGNAYVTAAKKLLYGESAIDMVAGPSEILVLADAGAPADFIAADLLSQAEHGSGREQAVLISTDFTLFARVSDELAKQKATLPKLKAVEKVLEQGLFFIEADSEEEAAEIANSYAPEHLEVMTEKPRGTAKLLNSAGAIFLGPWTPEPIGDFCAGPSHVLPTAGSAKFFSGITVSTFLRRSSLLEYTHAAVQKEIGIVETFGRLEELSAHGRSGSIRRR
ncbi:MAG: histidinol dehydrogenase [Victivallaceae bacterium]|nr:histidinol dehydrogenase [Victivallaceae bacterium]